MSKEPTGRSAATIAELQVTGTNSTAVQFANLQVPSQDPGLQQVNLRVEIAFAHLELLAASMSRLFHSLCA